jgi:hypothetical protein
MTTPTTIDAAPAPLPPRFLADRLVGELPVLGIALALFVGWLAVMAAKGIYFSPSIVLFNFRLYLVTAVAMLMLNAGWKLWRNRPASPIGWLREHYSAPEQRALLFAGLPMLAMLGGFMPFFSKVKAMIPLFTDYTWDATFIAWDRALFFGHDAWEVLQPVLGFPVVTSFLAILYHLWLLLIYPGCLFFVFYRVDADVRRRFFLGFVLSWTLIGGLLATLLASVGPAFLEPLVGDAHFAGQMAYLEAAHEQVGVMTVPVQHMLLEWFHSDARGLGSGITAMPSMHVAMAFLYYLAMRRVSRRAGQFFLAFFIAIWVGSVHLAYHYAVDGLVSVAAVSAIWWLSGHVFRRWDRFAASLRLPSGTLAAA